MLKVKRRLDLIVLGLHPSILSIAVCVKLAENCETLLVAAFVNEPARTLGEEIDEKSEDSGGDTLKTERDTPLTIVVSFKADVARDEDISKVICRQGRGSLNHPYPIQLAHRAPTPSINCCRAVIRPRIVGCASSAWYSGTLPVRNIQLVRDLRILVGLVENSHHAHSSDTNTGNEAAGLYGSDSL